MANQPSPRDDQPEPGGHLSGTAATRLEFVTLGGCLPPIARAPYAFMWGVVQPFIELWYAAALEAADEDDEPEPHDVIDRYPAYDPNQLLNQINDLPDNSLELIFSDEPQDGGDER